jgi:hypothetical protein
MWHGTISYRPKDFERLKEIIEGNGGRIIETTPLSPDTGDAEVEVTDEGMEELDCTWGRFIWALTYTGGD